MQNNKSDIKSDKNEMKEKNRMNLYNSEFKSVKKSV